MSYRDTLRTLVGNAERQVVALHAARQAGKVDDETFVAVLAALIAGANTRAYALADLSLAATVTVALRRPVAPLGLLPPVGDADRLHKAAQTLLAALPDTPDPLARVARLGRSEPLTSAARAYSQGMAASPHVTGWTRQTSGKACELCESWRAGGTVWPADTEMPTHKGCGCTPQPVTT